MPKKILHFIISSLLFFSCSEYFKTREHLVVPAEKCQSSDDTLMRDSLRNCFFTRLHKAGSIGITGKWKIPDRYKGKSICVVYRGNVRSNFAQSKSSICLSGNSELEKECLVWRGTPLGYHITQVNKWCPFRDSITLPDNIKGNELYSITLMAFMSNLPGEKLDIDTLEVWCKVKKW